MTAAKAPKTKPVAGHKCAGATLGVRVACECGWSTGYWCGPGARKEAYAEWRGHVAQHAKAGQ